MISSGATLLSLCVSLISVSKGDKVFEQPEDKTIFIKGQDIAVITERADLILEINLSKVRSDYFEVCEYSDVLQNASISGLVTNRFLDICLDYETRWYRTRDLFGLAPTDQDRLDTRGVFSTVTSFLLGGVSAAIWGDDHSTEAIDALKEDANMLHQAILSEDTKVAMNADHIEEIVRVMIRMAHAMGLEVICEGVETREQLDFLKSHNCDHAQGYYFSKPRTVAEITDVVLGIRNGTIDLMAGDAG